MKEQIQNGGDSLQLEVYTSLRTAVQELLGFALEYSGSKIQMAKFSWGKFKLAQ